MNQPFPSEIELERRIGVKKDVFFRRLLVSDANMRMQMINLVVKELEHMIDDNQVDLLDAYYPAVVRLAREAPFKAMRDHFSRVVQIVQAKWPQFESVRCCSRVSHFVENQDIEQIDNKDEQLCRLFRNAFLQTGRVTHFVQLLAWHKSYLELFQTQVQSVMSTDGSLPLPWRHYIALMASAEFRCHYMADLQQYYFVVAGGDYNWIRGIDDVDPKLFRLHELSSYLAHRPWLLTSHHIAELLSSEQEDSWSVSELVHAIIVLCCYHAACSVALGMGCAEEEDLAIISELDMHDKMEFRGSDSLRNSIGRDVNGSVLNSPLSTSSSYNGEDLAAMDRDETMLFRRLAGNKSFETEGETDSTEEEDEFIDDEETFEVADHSVPLAANSPTQQQDLRIDNLWRFCGGAVVRYADFDVKSDCYNVLHTEDFSWDEHCFSLVKRYFPGEAGQILEDLFNLTGKMTYERMGYVDPEHQDIKIDTTPFRDAIWYYVHRIFGICHDDYDYRLVNRYLNRPTKLFIKKVACTPWKVRQRDFEHFDHTLDPSEKCHLVLIVAEARKQAGLMYGLRAVMEHMR